MNLRLGKIPLLEQGLRGLLKSIHVRITKFLTIVTYPLNNKVLSGESCISITGLSLQCDEIQEKLSRNERVQFR